MGLDWVFGAKFQLDTTKSTHLLHTLLTLLSNQGWPKDAPKNRNFQFLVRSYHENVSKRIWNKLTLDPFLLSTIEKVEGSEECW